MIEKIRKNVIFRPLSWLYGGVTDLRNSLFDRGSFATFRPDIPCISVGNLTVGGTGKTPFTEFLVRELSQQYRLAILSRGYGRSSKGFIAADSRSDAETIGDEPLQFYKRFAPTVRVCVCEKRKKGIEAIRKLFPEISLIILDDAFQHRAVAPQIQILLNDYNRPFYHDHPFPGGDLRERRKGASRADLIVTTKCPDPIPPGQKIEISDSIKKWSSAPVFFAGLSYGEAVNHTGTRLTSPESVTVVSGIAQNLVFQEYVVKHYQVVQVKSFPDHYRYSLRDLQELRSGKARVTSLLTTEKDFVKLLPLALQLGIADSLFYLPVAIDLREDYPKFTQYLSHLLDTIGD